MTKTTCYGNGGMACDPHRDQSKVSKGEANQEMKHGQSSSSSRPQAAKKKTWKRYLTLLSKFQNKMKRKIKPGDCKEPSSFKQRNTKRCRPVLEECRNLVRVVRRTAADCFATAAEMVSGAGDGDELPSYVQLDRVSYGMKREAFGPKYLVTYAASLVMCFLIQLSQSSWLPTGQPFQKCNLRSE